MPTPRTVVATQILAKEKDAVVTFGIDCRPFLPNDATIEEIEAFAAPAAPVTQTINSYEVNEAAFDVDPFDEDSDEVPIGQGILASIGAGPRGVVLIRVKIETSDGQHPGFIVQLRNE